MKAREENEKEGRKGKKVNLKIMEKEGKERSRENQ